MVLLLVVEAQDADVCLMMLKVAPTTEFSESNVHGATVERLALFSKILLEQCNIHFSIHHRFPCV